MSQMKRYLAIALSFAICMTIFAAFAPRIAHAVTATLVQVANTASNPVPTQPAPRQVVRLTCDLAIAPGSFGHSCAASETNAADYIVPPGKLLVIDFVSGQGVAFSATQKPRWAGLEVNGIDIMRIPYTVTSTSNVDTEGIIASNVVIYVQQGSGVTIQSFNDGTAGGNANFHLHGHLEDAQ